MPLFADLDNYSRIFGSYIFRDYQSGSGMGTVDASFPPEFDYPDQFETTKKFIAGQQNR